MVQRIVDLFVIDKELSLVLELDLVFIDGCYLLSMVG